LLDEAPDKVAHRDAAQRRTGLEGAVQIIREIDGGPHGIILVQRQNECDM
jgi:hypothetical protein